MNADSPRKLCPACGRWFRWMTAHLLTVHGETPLLWLTSPSLAAHADSEREGTSDAG